MSNKMKHILLDRYVEHYYVANNDNVSIEKLGPHSYASNDLMYKKYVQKLPHGSKVLDLGCGVGFLLSWLNRFSNIDPVGIDISNSQIALCRKHHPALELHCADGLTYLENNISALSGIFCFDFIEHIEKEYLLEYTRAIYNSLIPGGFVIFRVPNAANMFGLYSRYIDLTHELIFTKASLLQLIRASGFVECTIIKYKSSRLATRFRESISYCIHYLLFRITGRKENVFSKNVHIVAYKDA